MKRKMKKRRVNYFVRNSDKLNINPYMKRRPVKRTAFHRIGSRKQ